MATIDPNWDKNSYALKSLYDTESKIGEYQGATSDINVAPAIKDPYERVPENIISLRNKFTTQGTAEQTETDGTVEQVTDPLAGQKAFINDGLAINLGKEGAKEFDSKIDRDVEEYKKLIPSYFTPELEEMYRFNQKRNRVEEASYAWGGSPVKPTLENLETLSRAKGYSLGDIIATGYASRLKDDFQREHGAFSRGNNLAELDYQFKKEFFDKDNPDKIYDVNNSLEKLDYFFTNPDDGMGFMAGQMWDGIAGMPNRVTGSTAGSVLAGGMLLTAGALLAPVTGGLSIAGGATALGAWGLGTAAFLDNYKTTKVMQAHTALSMDPTLDKDEIFNSQGNTASALGQSVLLTAADIATAKVGGRFIHAAMEADKAMSKLSKGQLARIAENKKAVYTNSIKDAAQNLGLSFTAATTLTSAAATAQEFTANVLGGAEDLSQNVYDAAFEGGKMGAMFGALPAAALPVKFGMVYRNVRKAQQSAIRHANQKIVHNTIKGTDMYNADPVQAMATAEQMPAFNETRFNINSMDLEDHLQQKGIRIEDTPFADKVRQADENGDTEVSFTLQERERMGKDWDEVFDKVAKKEIDDIPPEQVATVLTEDSKKQYNELVAQYGNDILQREKERSKTEGRIIDDMHEGLTKTRLPMEKQETFITMSTDLFKNLSELTGKSMGELWEKYKPAISKLAIDLTLGEHSGPVRKNADKKGRYIPANREIQLADDADMITGVHEYSHFTLDVLMNIGKEEKRLRQAGENVPKSKLEEMLDNALGEDWENKTGKELEGIHEKFVYQMLDSFASGEGKYASTPLIRNIRRMIVAGERRRYKELSKLTDQSLPTEVREQLALEYKARYGSDLPTRNEGFNALSEALYRGEEISKVLDENYSPDSIARYFEANEEVQNRILAEHPELANVVKEMNKRAEDAQDARTAAVQAVEMRQTGRMFSFNDIFNKKFEENTWDHAAVERWTKNNSMIKQVFETARKAISDYFKTSPDMALYRYIKEHGILQDRDLNDMVTLGMVRRSTVDKLKERGLIRKEADETHQPLSVTDYLGKIDAELMGGKKNRKAVKTDDVGRILEMIARFPDDEDLINHLAKEWAIKDFKSREIIATSDDGLRKTNIKTRAGVAKDNATMLKAITQGNKGGKKNPADAVAIERANDDQIIDLAAEKVVGSTRIRDLNESNTMRKAASNNRKSKEYCLHGEYDKSLKANRAERMALTVSDKIIDAKNRITRNVKKHVDILRSTAKHEKEVGKKYDNNILDLGRYIATKWGVITKFRREISLDDLRTLAAKDEELKALIDKAETSGMLDDNGYWKNKTVEQLDKFNEMLCEIETVAKNRKEIEIGGKTYDADQLAAKVQDVFNFQHYFKDVKDKDGNIIHYKGEIMLDKDGNPVLRESAKRGTENKDKSSSVEQHWWDKQKRLIRKGLGRTLNWCNRWDNGEGGIISEALYQVTHEISALGEKATSQNVKEINDLLRSVKWKEGRIVAHELIDFKTGRPLRFGDGKGLDGCGQQHIVGMLLHFGNEENFTKLVQGMQWKEEQVNAFITRMIKEGVIDEQILDLVQKFWDKYDKNFKLADAAYYEMHGTHMKQVKAREFSVVLANGKVKKMRGGYAPLMADLERAPERVQQINWDAATPNSVESALGITPNGITDPNWSKDRTNAIYPVEMNLIRLLNMIPKTASFAATMPQIKKAYNFWGRDDIRATLDRVDPHAYDDVVKYSFVRLLKRNAEKSGDEYGASAMKQLVGNVGMSIMFLNIPNVVTQFSGIPGAMSVVKPGHLIKSLSTGVVGYALEKERICSESLLMRSRIVEADSNLMDNVMRITSAAKGDTVMDRLLNINRRSHDFQQRWAYIAQKVVQDRIDVAVYNGAFEQAKERIFIEKSVKAKRGELPDGTDLNKLTPEEYKQCISSAEQAVIKTQSSSNTLDKSAVENVTWLKPFMQFYNYFITQGNLIAESFKRATNADVDTATKIGFMTYVYTMSTVLPSLIAEGIMKTARGDWWNDDLDGDDLMLDMIVQPLKMSSMGIPVFGSMVNTMIDSSIKGTNTTQQLINTPLFSSLNSDWIGFRRMLDGKFDGRGIKTIGHMVSLSGHPFAYYIAKQLGNWYDVATGNIKNDGAIDAARMAVTTSVRSDTRQR